MTIERMITPFELKAAEDRAGEFSGYGAVFGNVDACGDTIARGAFAESLREWRATKRLPPMLLQHGGGGFGGGAEDAVPIGKWIEMREDDRGLFVSGRLIALETDVGRRVHAAMREGVLDGLSIGFRVKAADLGTKPGEPARTLRKIDLVEVSVVTFPANDAARVSDVKASEWTVRTWEQFLRDAGYSTIQAKTIIAKGLRPFLRDAEVEDETAVEYARALREFKGSGVWRW